VSAERLVTPPTEKSNGGTVRPERSANASRKPANYESVSQLFKKIVSRDEITLKPDEFKALLPKGLLMAFKNVFSFFSKILHKIQLAFVA
jgi:hypothetical protein